MASGSTCRVFAGELNQSSYSLSHRIPNVKAVLTKSGAWCQRLFIVGALTEFLKREHIIQARVADPTGTFNIRTSINTTDIDDAFSTILLPTFVAMTGTVYLYSSGGIARVFVNPEVIRMVEKVVRDEWVLSTSKITIQRLEMLKEGLTKQNADEHVMAAIHYYKITMKDIDEFRDMVRLALETVTSVYQKAMPTSVDIRSMILEILASYPSKTNIPLEDLCMAVAKFGITRDQANVCLQSLLADGECYSPRNGFIRLL